MSRGPFTPEQVLDQFDEDELLEGYLSGINREPEPGDNRSDAYWVGWRNGAGDRGAPSLPWQGAVAKEFLRRLRCARELASSVATPSKQA